MPGVALEALQSNGSRRLGFDGAFDEDRGKVRDDCGAGGQYGEDRLDQVDPYLWLVVALVTTRNCQVVAVLGAWTETE